MLGHQRNHGRQHAAKAESGYKAQRGERSECRRGGTQQGGRRGERQRRDQSWPPPDPVGDRAEHQAADHRAGKPGGEHLANAHRCQTEIGRDQRRQERDDKHVIAVDHDQDEGDDDQCDRRAKLAGEAIDLGVFGNQHHPLPEELCFIRPDCAGPPRDASQNRTSMRRGCLAEPTKGAWMQR